MSKVISQQQVTKWFEDLEGSLKDRIVQTQLSASSDREEYYHLFQAAQILKSRFLEDFTIEYTPASHQYDEEGI